MERLVASGRGGAPVRRLGGDRAGATRLTRFLRNPSVDPVARFAEEAVRGTFALVPASSTRDGL